MLTQATAKKIPRIKETLFIAGISGNSRQRRLVVRQWRKKYIVQHYGGAGQFMIGTE